MLPCDDTFQIWTWCATDWPEAILYFGPIKSWVGHESQQCLLHFSSLLLISSFEATLENPLLFSHQKTNTLKATSFPGSFIFFPGGGGLEMKEPGNEVALTEASA